MSEQDKEQRFEEKSEVGVVLPLSTQNTQNQHQDLKDSKIDENMEELQQKENNNNESNTIDISKTDNETTLQTNKDIDSNTTHNTAQEQSKLTTATVIDEINSLILSPLRQLSQNQKGNVAPTPPVIGLSMKNSKFSINRELDLSHFEGADTTEISQPLGATSDVAKVPDLKSTSQEINHSQKDIQKIKIEQDKRIEGQIETYKNNKYQEELQRKQNNERENQDDHDRRKKIIEESNSSQEDEKEESKEQINIEEDNNLKEQSNIDERIQIKGESTSTDQNLTQQHLQLAENIQTSNITGTTNISPQLHLISYAEKEQICDQVISSCERQTDTKSQDSLSSSPQQIDVSSSNNNNNNNNIINNCSHVTPTYAAPIHEKELVLRVMSIIDGMATLMSDDLSSVHMPLMFLPTPIACGSILRLYIDTDTSLQQTQINNIIQIQQDILHNENYLQNH